MAEHYAQRASAGLLIAEATMVAADGCAFTGEPGIFDDACVAGWRGVTAAVHAAGGRMQSQIWHPGRSAHSSLNGGVQPISSGERAIQGFISTPDGRQPYETPRRLRDDELPAIVDLFRQATRRAMQAGLALLKPRLQQTDLRSSGKVVIGTVKGDLHDIGKNLVAMMLEGAGFEIVDLGTDVSPDKFVTAAREHQADLVAMSALLTTTMPNMKVTIDALQTAGLRQQVKVIIGGAPITESFARQVGADGYAPDASRAVAVAKSLL